MSKVKDIDLMHEVTQLDTLKRQGLDTQKQHKKVVSMIKQYNSNLPRSIHMSISKTRDLLQYCKILKLPVLEEL